MNNEGFGGREVVIRALVGSHNYNLNTKTSDRDYKYFVIPTFDDLYFGKLFSTSYQAETKDYDCHDIRQLSNLLWKANINFIEVLFSQDLLFHSGLSWLFDHKNELASMNMPYLYKATMGMHYQKASSLHKGTAKTQSLIERFGYDTKQATHALRCLFMVERLAGGMPMDEALWFEESHKHWSILRSLKAGEFTESEFNKLCEVWKTKNHQWVSDWFAQKKTNENLKLQLDEEVKIFVRLGF